MEYLGSSAEDSLTKVAIFGVPYDGTSSYRSGSKYGPEAFRSGSKSLETYSPFLHRDLASEDFTDFGDLDLQSQDVSDVIEAVYKQIGLILSKQIHPVLLGGEHTVTLGSIQKLVELYPDLNLLYLGAHAHLRDEYDGKKVCSETVMHCALDIVPAENTYRFGIRSGSRQELELAGLPTEPDQNERNLEQLLNSIPAKVPLYITLNMDVFDPSLVPGVSNPEPLGMTYREFLQLSRNLSQFNFIGFDVVGLAPEYDTSGVSSVVGASVVRELLLNLFD